MKIYGKKLKTYLVLRLLKICFLLFLLINLYFNETLSQNECNYDNAIKKGYLESPIYDLEGIYNITKLSWSGSSQYNNFVGFQIASSLSTSTLANSPEFYGNGFNNDFIVIKENEIYRFNVLSNPHKNIRYFKYRIYLASCEEGSFPFINKISIYYAK
jgi:hypothetical protein